MDQRRPHNGDTPVQFEGDADWKPLSSLAEVSGSFNRPSLTSPLEPITTGAESPASIRVFGLLNIVWGLLGLLTLPFSFFQLPMVATRYGYRPFTRDWLVFSCAISLIGSAVLIVSGLGLRKLKSWARALAVYYSIFACAVTVIGLGIVINGISTNTLLPESERSGAIAAKVFGAGLGLAYYVLLIVFLRRKQVKDALGEIV